MFGNWVYKWLINRDMDMCFVFILFFVVNYFFYFLFELNMYYLFYFYDNFIKIF